MKSSNLIELEALEILCLLCKKNTMFLLLLLLRIPFITILWCTLQLKMLQNKGTIVKLFCYKSICGKCYIIIYEEHARESCYGVITDTH